MTPAPLAPEQRQPHIDAVCAAYGKDENSVEFYCLDGSWSKHTDLSLLHRSPHLYRIKPFVLPPPPPGREWHRTDWTRDMLPKGYRPLLNHERPERGDEVLMSSSVWQQQDAQQLELPADYTQNHQRTTRPLPTPEQPPAPSFANITFAWMGGVR